MTEEAEKKNQKEGNRCVCVCVCVGGGGVQEEAEKKTEREKRDKKELGECALGGDNITSNEPVLSWPNSLTGFPRKFRHPNI